MQSKRSDFELGKALLNAIRVNNLKLVQSLFNDGARPNAATDDESGYSCLHYAVSNGNEKLTKLLISHGADLGAKDKKERTPIMLAWDKRLTHIIKLITSLVTTDADDKAMYSFVLLQAVHAKDRTALDLLTAGADPNKFWPPYGITCLHAAVLACDVQMIQTLLAFDADPLQKNQGDEFLTYNETPIETAKRLADKYFFDNQRIKCLKYLTHFSQIEPYERLSGESIYSRLNKFSFLSDGDTKAGKTGLYKEAVFAHICRLKNSIDRRTAFNLAKLDPQDGATHSLSQFFHLQRHLLTPNPKMGLLKRIYDEADRMQVEPTKVETLVTETQLSASALTQLPLTPVYQQMSCRTASYESYGLFSVSNPPQTTTGQLAAKPEARGLALR